MIPIHCRRILDIQEQLKAKKQALEDRAIELQQTLDTMPDPEIIKAQAEMIRTQILVDCLTTEWQKQSYADLRRFLHFLFNDNPRKNNYGILLGKKNNPWVIDFEGCFDFNHILTDGQANLKASLSEDQKSKISRKMETKANAIQSYQEYQAIRDEREKLENLIIQLEKAENDVRDIGRQGLFVNWLYRFMCHRKYLKAFSIITQAHKFLDNIF